MSETDKTMQPDNQCPQCGGAVPAGAPEGLCPACLLKQAAMPDSQPRAPQFEPPPIEEVAKLFPQLEILALLGKGGMGAVYKARQPALDRVVALKILPALAAAAPVSPLDKPESPFAERFNREARALAKLSHPNIVAVFEFGQAGGMPFIIMEFVDGANLRQLLRERKFSPREALAVIGQICDALQYAHDEGVVHRDIKPENILIDRKSRVKIADFGLAKIMGGGPDAHLTVEGQSMGTPHYMAPEQVEHPQDVDHRADIFSLGVVFYELLTGELPLGKFPLPSSKVRIDVRLDDVVLRALEKEPERRYQQASEVRSRLENITQSSGQAPPIIANATAPQAAPSPRVRFFLEVALETVALGNLGVVFWSYYVSGFPRTLPFLFVNLLFAVLSGFLAQHYFKSTFAKFVWVLAILAMLFDSGAKLWLMHNRRSEMVRFEKTSEERLRTEMEKQLDLRHISHSLVFVYVGEMRSNVASATLGCAIPGNQEVPSRRAEYSKSKNEWTVTGATNLATYRAEYSEASGAWTVLGGSNFVFDVEMNPDLAVRDPVVDAFRRAAPYPGLTLSNALDGSQITFPDTRAVVSALRRTQEFREWLKDKGPGPAPIRIYNFAGYRFEGVFGAPWSGTRAGVLRISIYRPDGALLGQSDGHVTEVFESKLPGATMAVLHWTNETSRQEAHVNRVTFEPKVAEWEVNRFGVIYADTVSKRLAKEHQDAPLPEKPERERADYIKTADHFGAMGPFAKQFEADIQNSNQPAALASIQRFIEQLDAVKAELEGTELAVPTNRYSLCLRARDAVAAGDLTGAKSFWQAFGAIKSDDDVEYGRKIMALAEAQRKAREHPPEEVVDIILHSSATLASAIDMLAKFANLNIQYDANTLGGSNGQAFLDQTFPQETRWKGLTASKALLALLDNYGLQMIPNTNTGVASIARKLAVASAEAPDARALQLKLEYLEKQLAEVTKKEQLGVVPPSNVEEARGERDSVAAQLKGDTLGVAQVKLRLAEYRLKITTSRFNVGKATGEDVRKTKLERDLAELEVKKEQEKQPAK